MQAARLGRHVLVSAGTRRGLVYSLQKVSFASTTTTATLKEVKDQTATKSVPLGGSSGGGVTIPLGHLHSGIPNTEPLFCHRRPRLEEHFYTTLLPDLLVLSYQHNSPQADLGWLKRQAEWNLDAPASLYSTYASDLSTLPTLSKGGPKPVCTSLLSTLYGSPIKSEPSFPWRKKALNPIDYTSVPRRIFNAKPSTPTPPYSPLLSSQPFLHTIQLKIHAEAAVGNKSILFSAIHALTAITGVRAEPVFATAGDNSKKIRAGMPIGAVVRLSGPRMWDFLDKMIQTVLPRIREWEGLSPVVRRGSDVSFTLPETAIGYFPDIEPHFDMYVRLFETQVTLHTYGRTAEETLACLSGFQLPFQAAVKRSAGAASDDDAGEDNAYKALEKLRTRAERVEAAKKIRAAAASSSKK